MKFVRSMSVYSLHKKVTKLTGAGSLDAALKLIHDFVERILTAPLCTSQVFGSKTLDDLCQRIGHENLKAIQHANICPSSNFRSRTTFVYIVTKLQKSGGHSRVIQDFIGARPSSRHLILSTELAGRSDVAYFTEATSRADVTLELAPKGNFQQRLSWLQVRLLEVQPKKVYLFNHHQDSVAVAAIQTDMGLDGSFYHHGDHHLCLGVYLSHLQHIDPHPMGYYNCRESLGISNVYVPLSAEDKGRRPREWPFLQNGGLTTFTAARSNKIEIPYFVSYLDVIPMLLKTTGGMHIHIGRLSPWALARIYYGLKRFGLQTNRFVYKSWAPSIWSELLHYRVDLYLSSFPYGGALTMIEAMGAGVPVALHKHIFSSMLSGIDLAYPDAFSWRQPEELLDYCSSVTPEQLAVAGNSARLQFEQFHSTKQFHRFMSEHEKYLTPLNGRPIKFLVETDEWAVWMDRRISVQQALSIAIYRFFRKIRSHWI
jgi:hypothetical protein